MENLSTFEESPLTTKKMLRYITFSISIAIISWIVGLTINALLVKTSFYQKKLAKLTIIRNPDFSKRIGLGIFLWIVQNSFFKYFNPKLSIKKKIKISELDNLRYEMTIAEVGHLIAFLFVMIFAMVKVFNGQFLFALIMMVINILLNLYPSLLQQENKKRIDQFKIKLRSRPSAG
ncbi:glycosyl-4,4'-diaponeurosporenoate acyltransferase CrtO family protein [Pedobacter kyonggii]|nr:hypothetical protein [Pedobacter kyonggii]